MALSRPVYPFGVADVPRILRAIATNAVALAAPRAYVRLVAETGRGAREESEQEVADYLAQCFSGYVGMLDAHVGDGLGYLQGKRVLEYGPGDVLGVALLLIAHGAERVVCVDRFPVMAMSAKNVAILRRLLDRLDGTARTRADHCFRSPGDPASGFVPDRIHYLTRASGLSGLRHTVDITLSRAVLEHVNDLFGTFSDMEQALVPGGMCLHLVDLKSHGLHRYNRLDFLTWPPLLWWCMYSYKGAPNRWRIDRYRDALARAGLALQLLQINERASSEEIRTIRPHLSSRFATLADDDLSPLSFWLLAKKQSTMAAAKATICAKA